MRAAVLLALAAGCGGPEPAPPRAPVEVRVRVEAAKVGSGEAVELGVEVWAEEGWTVPPIPLSTDELEVGAEAEEPPVRSGLHTRSARRLSLRGADGSYVVDPGAVTATGPGGETLEIDPAPLFVDIGVPGASGGPIEEYAAPPPPARPRWGLVAAAVGGALLLAVGAFFAVRRWRARAVPPPPPEPPDAVAWRAWRAARASVSDDHALALALSRVFREYLEAISSWPATTRTTREILAHLEAETRFGAALRLRSGHVLDATDRLKFAREGGGTAFFDELESDFATVVEATRPRTEAADA